MKGLEHFAEDVSHEISAAEGSTELSLILIRHLQGERAPACPDQANAAIFAATVCDLNFRLERVDMKHLLY